MHLRQIRFVFMTALLVAATAHADETPTRKCNAPAAECERAIRSLASGRRYLGALVQEMTLTRDEPPAAESFSGGVGLPIPPASKAARKGHSRGEKSES